MYALSHGAHTTVETSGSAGLRAVETVADPAAYSVTSLHADGFIVEKRTLVSQKVTACGYRDRPRLKDFADNLANACERFHLHFERQRLKNPALERTRSFDREQNDPRLLRAGTVENIGWGKRKR
jgi:hypothetical protein